VLEQQLQAVRRGRGRRRAAARASGGGPSRQAAAGRRPRRSRCRAERHASCRAPARQQVRAAVGAAGVDGDHAPRPQVSAAAREHLRQPAAPSWATRTATTSSRRSTTARAGPRGWGDGRAAFPGVAGAAERPAHGLRRTGGSGGQLVGRRRRARRARSGHSLRRLPRLRRRRSRSDSPPQMPNARPGRGAYSRHSALTSQPTQMRLASLGRAALLGEERLRVGLGAQGLLLPAELAGRRPRRSPGAAGSLISSPRTTPPVGRGSTAAP
jgi:hypothetical protein